MIKPNTHFKVDVTINQVDFFNNNGYLSIDRITTDEEIKWLKQIYNKLFQERAGEEQGQYFDLGGPRAHTGQEVLPQVLGPENQFPELRKTTFFKNNLNFEIVIKKGDGVKVVIIFGFMDCVKGCIH